MQLASFLMDDGRFGFALLAELRERFPRIGRDDVFRAIACAWSYQQAGWLADVLEVERLKGALPPQDRR